MTHLPASVREPVEAALARIPGHEGSIESAAPVSGGCIHNGLRIETRGGSLFLKWNASAPHEMFVAEADGLEALRGAAEAADAGVRIPRALAWSGRGSSVEEPETHHPAWLLLEYLPPAPPQLDSSERLGRSLAALHDADVDGTPGWATANWIGSLPQDNRPATGWADFWAARRIGPQLALARQHGSLTEPAFDRLLDVIPQALEDVGRPALLHGDLWSGNTFTTEGGGPVLIDPAVYIGDGEVDLAMTELFGGFGDRFHHAYREMRPVSAAYGSHRRDLYQLYYLLVHVNLFGASYAPAARRAAEGVVSALR